MHTVKLPDFLSRLFDQLEKNDVCYAVARNYEHLGSGDPGRDIDILIEKCNVAHAISLISSQGIIITGIVAREYVTSIYCVGIEWGEHLSLGIDLVHRLDYRAVPYINIADVLKRRQRYSSGRLEFWIPDDIDEALIILMENLIVGGILPEKYWQNLTSRLGDSPAALERIGKRLGKSCALKLFKTIGDNNPEAALSIRSELVRSLLCRGFLFHPVTSSLNAAIHVYHELFIRLSGRHRKTVCFLGPDGAGKSTLIDLFCRKLKYAAGKITVRHLKPVLFLRRRTEQRGIVTEPHALPLRSGLLSNIKILMWWFELWADRLSKQNRTLSWEIYDRCMWDVLVDPKRYRFSGGTWFLSLLLRISPRIDSVVVVTTAPETIQARKAEVPLAETERQVGEYRKLSKDRGFLLFENDGDPEVFTETLLYRISEVLVAGRNTRAGKASEVNCVENRS